MFAICSNGKHISKLTFYKNHLDDQYLESLYYFVKSAILNQSVSDVGTMTDAYLNLVLPVLGSA